MKFWSALDLWVSKTINYFVGAAMVFLTAIVFIQVLTRYVFKVSIGGVAELPVFTMIFSVWLASILLAREDSHIRLEIMPLIFKSKTVLKLIKLLINIIIIVSMSFFTYLSLTYVQFGIKTGDSSAGLGFPLWWVTSVMVISGSLMTIYYLLHLYKSRRGEV